MLNIRKKMHIALYLSVSLSALFLYFVSYYIYKKVHKEIYIELMKFFEEYESYLCKKEKIFELNINLLQNQINKTFYALSLLKNFQSYSVAKTITDILEAPTITNSLQINILFLENLKEEYSHLKKGLMDQLKHFNKETDAVQKEKLNSIINELDNTILILSTISDESSVQYIEEIFKEVTASFMKIQGINNI